MRVMAEVSAPGCLENPSLALCPHRRPPYATEAHIRTLPHTKAKLHKTIIQTARTSPARTRPRRGTARRVAVPTLRQVKAIAAVGVRVLGGCRPPNAAVTLGGVYPPATQQQ